MEDVPCQLKIEEDEPDPWVVAMVVNKQTPWKELETTGKLKRITIGIVKGILLIGLLYFFVCSLDVLALGFRLVGGRTTGEIFKNVSW